MHNTQSRWMVAIMGTFLQLALGTVYAWSYFQQPVMKLGSWNNTQVAWAFSLAILFLGLSAAWGGINLPKYGPRKLAMSGGILFSAGYIIAGFALASKSLWLLYIGYGIIGGVGLGLGYVTPVATAAKWFPDKKGFITGMVVMGFGFGAMLMSKVIAPLFLYCTQGDLVGAFYRIGVLMLFVTVSSGYFLTNPPAGFVPVGYIPPTATQSITNHPSCTARECVTSKKFLLIWLVFFCNITAGIMFIGFQSPLLQDLLRLNFPPHLWGDPKIIAELATAGATLIAISSVFNGLGRFFWGGLSDKLGRVQAFRFILGTQLLVLIALLFISNPNVFSILVCYILLCYGGGFGTMPSFILDVFGTKLMAVVYGAVLTAWGMGGVVGPPIVAIFKDSFPTQAAHYTFITAAILLTIGLIATLMLDNKPYGENQ